MTVMEAAQKIRAMANRDWKPGHMIWVQLMALADELGTRATEPAASEPTWRCFHCDEVFSTADDAKVHFGPTEYSNPACQINATEYREMEERMRRYNAEDADIHRQWYALESKHQTEVLRAEETGYARGLRDAALYPAELGLQVAAPKAEPGEAESL